MVWHYLHIDKREIDWSLARERYMNKSTVNLCNKVFPCSSQIKIYSTSSAVGNPKTDSRMI